MRGPRPMRGVSARERRSRPTRPSRRRAREARHRPPMSRRSSRRRRRGPASAPLSGWDRVEPTPSGRSRNLNASATLAARQHGRDRTGDRRSATALEDRRHRQAQVARGHGREQLRLVVAAAAGRGGRGTGTMTSPPAATAAQRRAIAALSGLASRCSAAYFRSWRARRTVPEQGAHHPAGEAGAGCPRAVRSRTPGGSRSRASSLGMQAAQIGSLFRGRTQRSGPEARGRACERRCQRGGAATCRASGSSGLPAALSRLSWPFTATRPVLQLVRLRGLPRRVRSGRRRLRAGLGQRPWRGQLDHALAPRTRGPGRARRGS